jgi:hypothetical protein
VCDVCCRRQHDTQKLAQAILAANDARLRALQLSRHQEEQVASSIEPGKTPVTVTVAVALVLSLSLSLTMLHGSKDTLTGPWELRRAHKAHHSTSKAGRRLSLHH